MPSTFVSEQRVRSFDEALEAASSASPPLSLVVSHDVYLSLFPDGPFLRTVIGELPFRRYRAKHLAGLPLTVREEAHA